jgi:hypothetical protein
MSAIGPKQTWAIAMHMSAFGGKADITFCGMSAFAVAIGGEAEVELRCEMSVVDPKRTWVFPRVGLSDYDARPSLGGRQ